MAILYGRTSDNIMLSDALKNCANALFNDKQAIALFYSPRRCEFAKVNDDGALIDKNDKNVNIESIFELRAFNQTCELRWLNNLDGEGKAVLISDSDISQYLQHPIAELHALDKRKQEYILWGEFFKNSSSKPGWGKLAKSRIGSIDVPITGLTAEKLVYLTAIEYFKADEKYGNVSVVEERLTGLEVK